MLCVVLWSNLFPLCLHDVIEEASLGTFIGPRVHLFLVLSHWVVVKSTFVLMSALKAHLYHVTDAHRVVQTSLCPVEFVLA